MADALMKPPLSVTSGMVQLCYGCCADEASTERHVLHIELFEQKGNGCVAEARKAALCPDWRPQSVTWTDSDHCVTRSPG